MDMIASETGRFVDPDRTASGEARARVPLQRLETLWLNTGTLCNLTCGNCYIESSPSNDRLSYLTRSEVQAYLEEVAEHDYPVREIGITGGEPFMNPHLPAIMEDCLSRGFEVLVLTNAMRPMMKCAGALQALNDAYGQRLTLRVSLDHHDPALHEMERGRNTWDPALAGLRWLSERGFRVHVAARTRWGDEPRSFRLGFARLFQREGIGIDAFDERQLVLFPELDEGTEVPEITSACWGILGVDPAAMMCATARMVVKRRGASAPEVVACTLLPYSEGFSLGNTLAQSLEPVALNHPHCARFCVLGGGSCSP
jgi:uncharacterized Fe-S cluster-containing radical SAM superfamily protein